VVGLRLPHPRIGRDAAQEMAYAFCIAKAYADEVIAAG